MATRGMNQGGADSEDDDGPPRQYIGPPRPRKGTAQALIWNFMMPYSSAEGSRNVECCILVPDTDGSGMRKCGATFKHTMGGCPCWPWLTLAGAPVCAWTGHLCPLAAPVGKDLSSVSSSRHETSTSYEYFPPP